MGGCVMSGKGQVGRRVERVMDFPAGTLAKATLMEVEGNRRVVVTGCRGILTYGEDSISLRIPEGVLTFYGQELEMNSFTADGATVIGRLQRIEFSEGEPCC